MEQVEGGDLVVNRGDESKPKESGLDSSRDFNSVDGYDAALKLAQVSVQAKPDVFTDRRVRKGKSR